MRDNPTLEVLISTMNRKDLSFLVKMFPVLDLKQYKILIINQTKLSEDLLSDVEGIRVINSREFGLSKSRNLAIENAIGDILLFSDDDIEYLLGFDQIILQAYKKYDKACLISFQYLDENRDLVKSYPKQEGYLNSTKQYLSSVEISFRREDVITYNIRMNTYFGLGTTFPIGEEQIFKSAFLQNKLLVAFVAKPILIHPGKTSASTLEFQKLIKSTTAQKYLQYNSWIYLWLLKYVFFLFRHNYISFSEQSKAYRTGLAGITEFKNLKDED